jgi:hypothetical protein
VRRYAQVTQRHRHGAPQQRADTRAVHFDAEEVALGMAFGEREQRIAVAEADLELARRRAAENIIQINRFKRVIEPVFGPEIAQRIGLRGRHAPFAPHEAAHGAQRQKN